MPKDVSPFAAYGIYGAAGLQLAISVVAFLFIGDYVDRKLNTSPWFTVTGLILGFIGGMVNLIRIVQRINISEKPKDK